MDGTRSYVNEVSQKKGKHRMLSLIWPKSYFQKKTSFQAAACCTLFLSHVKSLQNFCALLPATLGGYSPLLSGGHHSGPGPS